MTPTLLKKRAFADLRHKGNLTDTPEGALTRYAPLEGDPWGRDLSHDVLRRFCESLEGAPEILAPIETPAALLKGIDRAIEDLDAPEHVVVVLAGNWFDLQVGLGTANPEGYEASWRLPESERLGEIGRYRGHPILSARDYVDGLGVGPVPSILATASRANSAAEAGSV